MVGVLQGGQASALIFDMHSEYGWQGQDNDRGISVKGLKQLFGAKVSTFTLDEEHSRRRGVTPDETVRLGYNHIEPEDIELLRETLNLSQVAASAAYNLRERYGQEDWVVDFWKPEGRAPFWSWPARWRSTPVRYGPSTTG